MAYQSFENLDVWQASCRLTVDVYKLLDGSREFGLKDQMQRAAVSIPSNIAEGAERGSNRDFARFVRIAKGSAAELRTQLYIADRVGMISTEDREKLAEQLKVISAQLQRLAEALLKTNSISEVDEWYPLDLKPKT